MKQLEILFDRQTLVDRPPSIVYPTTPEMNFRLRGLNPLRFLVTVSLWCESLRPVQVQHRGRKKRNKRERKKERKQKRERKKDSIRKFTVPGGMRPQQTPAERGIWIWGALQCCCPAEYPCSLASNSCAVRNTSKVRNVRTFSHIIIHIHSSTRILNIRGTPPSSAHSETFSNEQRISRSL